MSTSTENNKITDTTIILEDGSKPDELLEEGELEVGDLGGAGMRKRAAKNLSIATRAYDRGHKGYLDEDEMLVRKYDENGDGKIDISEVFRIVHDVGKAKAEKLRYKRLFLLTAVFSTFLLAANFALTFAVAIVTRQTETNADGSLVDTSTQDLVATRSRGSHVTATVDQEYVNRRHRRKLGMETLDDLRALEEEADELVATLQKQEIVDAFAALEMDGTPISFSVTVDGVKYNELAAGSGLSTFSNEEGTYYEGLHAQELAEPTYKIHCPHDSVTCDVYQDSASSRR
jgi:hypothetical protein